MIRIHWLYVFMTVIFAAGICGGWGIARIAAERADARAAAQFQEPDPGQKVRAWLVRDDPAEDDGPDSDRARIPLEVRYRAFYLRHPRLRPLMPAWRVYLSPETAQTAAAGPYDPDIDDLPPFTDPLPDDAPDGPSGPQEAIVDQIQFRAAAAEDARLVDLWLAAGGAYRGWELPCSAGWDTGVLELGGLLPARELEAAR